MTPQSPPPKHTSSNEVAFPNPSEQAFNVSKPPCIISSDRRVVRILQSPCQASARCPSTGVKGMARKVLKTQPMRYRTAHADATLLTNLAPFCHMQAVKESPFTGLKAEFELYCEPEVYSLQRVAFQSPNLLFFMTCRQGQTWSRPSCSCPQGMSEVELSFCCASGVGVEHGTHLKPEPNRLVPELCCSQSLKSKVAIKNGSSSLFNSPTSRKALNPT